MSKSLVESLDVESLSPRDWRALEGLVLERGGAEHFRGGFGRRFSRKVASLAVRSLLDVTLATGRVRFDDPHGMKERVLSSEPTIATIWHQRLLGSILFGRKVYMRAGLPIRLSALVSESDDGELVASMIRDMGGHTLRGSTSRGAARALRGMIREIQRGGVTFLTPDGPRGPARESGDGVFTMARLTGAPLLPMSISFGRALCFQRSWDRFLVPLPFGRTTFFLGKAIFVPKKADAAAMASLKEEYLEAMKDLELRAEAAGEKRILLGRPREGR